MYKMSAETDSISLLDIKKHVYRVEPEYDLDVVTLNLASVVEFSTWFNNEKKNSKTVYYKVLLKRGI
jgi:hypothetical protein